MEEFKIKIWDCKNKKLIIPNSIELDTKTGAIKNIIIKKNKSIDTKNKDYIILNFTGCIDKKEQELWTNDIVEMIYPMDKKNKVKAMIKKSNEKAGYVAVELESGNNREFLLNKISCKNYFKKVGNIFEDENILKANKAI